MAARICRVLAFWASIEGVFVFVLGACGFQISVWSLSLLDSLDISKPRTAEASSGEVACRTSLGGCSFENNVHFALALALA